ncbi:MAG: hypothetical protein KC620_24500, partial [Myxococcales bacterium]|nr:hypothetical protein [Myxococcales bacterium]
MLLAYAVLKVLLLAGGSAPEENFDSHRVHVDALIEALAARGVPAEDVAIFWADGDDPKPDRAVVETTPPEEEWLIEGTRLDTDLALAPELRDTRFGERTVRPATRAALTAWLAEVGPTLTPADTLLIAVTDHGEPDPKGGDDTRISLWGESWSVSDLVADLAPVPETTRVVLWMSQCHSGG